MTHKELIREREELTVGLEKCAERFEADCVVKESLTEHQKAEALIKMQAYLDRTFSYQN